MADNTKQPFWKSIIDKKIGKTISLVAYFKQSLMATFFLLVFFLSWNSIIPIQNQIVFSAIASSTFLTFISTSIYDSLSKKIIGGQFVGVLIGVSLWYGMNYLVLLYPNFKQEIVIVFLSVSVGLSILFMSILNFEHPPAAGTAIAFISNSHPPAFNDFLFIMVCAILLGISHKFLKKYHLLKDLQGKDSKPKKLKRFYQYIKRK